MREMMARVMCVLASVMVIALSGLFAVRHNRSVPTEVPPGPKRQARAAPVHVSMPAIVDTARLARGRDVFTREQCGSCHAFAGEGNPRRPLDGVGTRLQAAELRDWITGTGAAEAQLSPATVRRKQRYAGIPADDLETLIEYLRATATAK